jgi:hypothetical protein
MPNLGIHKKFYRDTNTGVVFQYVADACIIQTRQLVAICIRLHDKQLSMIVGVAFKNLFVPASEAEVTQALQKMQTTTAKQMQPVLARN